MRNQVRVALLSYGMSGEVFHAPLLQAHAGFRLSTVLQRNADTAKLRYPDIKIVKKAEDIFNDAAIDLVVVNVPNEHHFDYAAQALNAGKHVVVEKPFTVTTEEADQLIALAKAKGKILTVFQNRRWDGDFMTVKNVIGQGWLGKVVELEVHYDRFRNYIEANTWKEEAGKGSGILYNLGSHMLDQVLTLFGMPEAVDARIRIQRPGGKVHDYYDIRMQYTDFYAIVKSSYLVREPGPRYIVHGTEGSFVKYGLDPQEQDLKNGKIPGSEEWGVEDKTYWGKLNTLINGIHVEDYTETIPGNYPGFYQNVYDAIVHGKPLDVKPEQARDNIRLIEACYESNDQKKSIKV